VEGLGGGGVVLWGGLVCGVFFFRVGFGGWGGLFVGVGGGFTGWGEGGGELELGGAWLGLVCCFLGGLFLVWWCVLVWLWVVGGWGFLGREVGGGGCFFEGGGGGVVWVGVVLGVGGFWGVGVGGGGFDCVLRIAYAALVC